MAQKTPAIAKIREELCVVGKFTVLDFNNILVEELPLENLEDAELYWIVEVASKYIDAIKAPDNYFEEAEIERFKYHIRHDDSKVSFPLEFDDAVKLAENQYAFPYSIGDIAKLKYNGLLEIVPDLQREGKKDKYGDIKVYTNPRRVKELTELYENREFSYNGIRFNLMDDGEAEFEYDSENKKIIINKGTIIIPDGNHRALATELVNPSKSCVDDKFMIFFTFFSTPKVKQTIAQEWNVQPVNKAHKEFMKTSNANKVVDAIKRNPNSDPLYTKRIVTTGREVQNGDGFIIYDILSKSVDRHYNCSLIETQDEILEIAEWLSIYLNRLTTVLLNDFKNFQIVKKNRWSINPYAFSGYILLSKYLKGRENWRDELKQIINSIDFDILKSPLENKKIKSNEKTMDMFFEEVAQNAKII